MLAGILRKRGGSGASAEHAWNEAISLYKGAICEVDVHGSARDRATVRRRLGELYSRMGRYAYIHQFLDFAIMWSKVYEAYTGVYGHI